jgi:uncharacterized protein (DUF1499 family)
MKNTVLHLHLLQLDKKNVNELIDTAIQVWIGEVVVRRTKQYIKVLSQRRVLEVNRLSLRIKIWL